MSTSKRWPLALCVCGFLISAYSTYVKQQVSMDPGNYRALCDLSQHASCSKVLTSAFSQGFGIAGRLFGKTSPLNMANTTVGIIFYSILFGLTCAWNRTWARKLSVALCLLATLSSVYLAYILIFILADFCVVCVSTYAVNVALLGTLVRRYRLAKFFDKKSPTGPVSLAAKEI